MFLKIRKKSFWWLVAIIFSPAVFALVFFQVKAADEPPPPKICGDGIIQSPNDNGEYEKCDDGAETEKCTAGCGQKMLGYGWSSGVGWISFNDDNCNGLNCDGGNCGAKYVEASLIKAYIAAALPAVITPEQALNAICPLQTQNYYVQANSQNQIQGWAWSDNLGWICFGLTCAEPAAVAEGGPAVPPSGQLAASLVFTDPAKPEVTGWAKIIGLKERGWISLSCQNEGNCGTVNCSDFDGDQTQCELNGCQYNTSQNICSGYKVRLIQGDFDGACSVSGSKCDPEATNCTPGVDLYCCNAGDSCVKKQRLTLSGWAWNGNDDNSGVGWIWFDPEISQILPWLQTRFGDVYARRGITSQQSPGYNATYRILANNDIVQFFSAQGSGWWTSEQFAPINLPRSETRYTNVLGTIDVKGLLCDFGEANSCLNKYGKTVVSLNDQPLASQQLLEGKIYYYAGDLEINSPITFVNGVNFQNGGGTIIVNGDLLIKRSVTYQNSSGLTNFRNLASVAWIVLGDLKISNQVPDNREDQLVGNFIVIGDGQNQCSSTPATEIASCGQIYSCCNFAVSPTACDRSECNLKRLTVSGLMMSKKFYFDRTYTEQTESPIQGSEVIIYDGRLLANTPPGLGDFAKALPIWRSGIFAQ